MNIKEFYEKIQGDYSGTMERLMKEERILKYLLRFKDAEDYPELFRALDEGNVEEIFRFSHNIKGVSLNLGLNKLAESASEFCDLFRHGMPEKDYNQELDKLKADYKETVDAINEIEA